MFLNVKWCLKTRSFTNWIIFLLVKYWLRMLTKQCSVRKNGWYDFSAPKPFYRITYHHFSHSNKFRAHWQEKYLQMLMTWREMENLMLSKVLQLYSLQPKIFFWHKPTIIELFNEKNRVFFVQSPWHYISFS